jgi:hypothetical protein
VEYWIGAPWSLWINAVPDEAVTVVFPVIAGNDSCFVAVSVHVSVTVRLLEMLAAVVTVA